MLQYIIHSYYFTIANTLQPVKQIQKYTGNLLHFHGGGNVVSVMFDGGQLAQRANNNVLGKAI